MEPNADLNLPPSSGEVPSAMATDQFTNGNQAPQGQVPQNAVEGVLSNELRSSSSNQASNSSAAEGDEAVWIQKAKQIVQMTVNDPFEQSRQLSALRADYLEKHYGKVIKLAS